MQEGKIIVARLWQRYKGAPPSRAPIVLGIDRRKYRTICIYLKKSSDAPNYFVEEGCAAYYLSRKKFFRVFNLPVIWKLSRILKRQRVDILHCHRHQAAVYGAIAAKLAGVPVVFSHVHGLNRSKSGRRKFINRIVHRWMSGILTVCQAAKDDVSSDNPSVDADKIMPIGNSIDHTKFAGVTISKERAREEFDFKKDAFIFGTVGRLVPTKGCEYLIDAFVEVKKAVPNAELVFVGDGRLHGELAQRAERSGCSDSITFFGRTDKVAEILRAFDAFVLSSIAEGMPRSLLEAMAVGTPCIGTDVGGIGEILDDGKCGIVVSSGDSAKLFEAMIELAKMPLQARAELAQKAQNRVRTEYNHNVVIKRLEDIYEQQLRASGKGDRSFSDYVKHDIDIDVIETKTVPVAQLAVQYNPDRFEKYRLLHEGAADSVLDMSLSPHCRLLRAYVEQGEGIFKDIKKLAYYKMLLGYGKSKKRARARVRKFMNLYESIKKDGFNSKILVAKKPFIENDHNKGYEIYEGHHRIACCIVLGIESVTADIVEARSKVS